MLSDAGVTKPKHSQSLEQSLRVFLFTFKAYADRNCATAGIAAGCAGTK